MGDSFSGGLPVSYHLTKQVPLPKSIKCDECTLYELVGGYLP